MEKDTRYSQYCVTPEGCQVPVFSASQSIRLTILMGFIYLADSYRKLMIEQGVLEDGPKHPVLDEIQTELNEIRQMNELTQRVKSHRVSGVIVKNDDPMVKDLSLGEMVIGFRQYREELPVQ